MNIIGLTKILKHKNFKALEGCPTPSICVAKCPDFEWSFNDGKVEGLRDFCYSMTDLEWNKQTIEDRIATKIFEGFGELPFKELIIGREPVSTVHYTRPGSCINCQLH